MNIFEIEKADRSTWYKWNGLLLFCVQIVGSKGTNFFVEYPTLRTYPIQVIIQIIPFTCKFVKIFVIFRRMESYDPAKCTNIYREFYAGNRFENRFLLMVRQNVRQDKSNKRKVV